MQVDLLFLLTVFDPHTFKGQLCQQTHAAEKFPPAGGMGDWGLPQQALF